MLGLKNGQGFDLSTLERACLRLVNVFYLRTVRNHGHEFPPRSPKKKQAFYDSLVPPYQAAFTQKLFHDKLEARDSFYDYLVHGGS